MEISEKRLAANRANARKSHGPSTEAGKRISSRNATRHGLLANAVVLEGESQERFNALLNSLNAEFQPTTPTERIFVGKMAAAQWCLMRLWAIESAAIAHEMRTQADSVLTEDVPTRAMLAMRALADTSRNSELNSRYEQRFDRQHYRALEGLRRLREENTRAKRSHFPGENKEPAQ
jgi:hypothetical protein